VRRGEMVVKNRGGGASEVRGVTGYIECDVAAIRESPGRFSDLRAKLLLGFCGMLHQEEGCSIAGPALSMDQTASTSKSTSHSTPRARY
jgi:hypothetical protein